MFNQYTSEFDEIKRNSYPQFSTILLNRINLILFHGTRCYKQNSKSPLIAERSRRVEIIEDIKMENAMSDRLWFLSK